MEEVDPVESAAFIRQLRAQVTDVNDRLTVCEADKKVIQAEVVALKEQNRCLEKQIHDIVALLCGPTPTRTMVSLSEADRLIELLGGASLDGVIIP